MAFVYRNPNADQAVVNNRDFFRIKQALVSAGDIFEVQQGGAAFALGPDSDVSLATVAYFDPQSTPPYSAQANPQQTNMSTFTISPQRAWSANIKAVNRDSNYVPSGIPGRVLIWPGERYDDTFLPVGFNPAKDAVVREPPVIDIIQYFSPPTTVASQRADKTYYYDRVPVVDSTGFTNILIPFYGRRYAAIQVQSLSVGIGDELVVNIFGVNFRISPGVAPTYNLLTLSDAAGTGGVSGSRSVVVGTGYNQQTMSTREITNAAAATTTTEGYQGGLFDYLQIRISAQNAHDYSAALRVVVSDAVGRTSL